MILVILMGFHSYAYLHLSYFHSKQHVAPNGSFDIAYFWIPVYWLESLVKVQQRIWLQLATMRNIIVIAPISFVHSYPIWNSVIGLIHFVFV